MSEPQGKGENQIPKGDLKNGESTKNFESFVNCLKLINEIQRMLNEVGQKIDRLEEMMLENGSKETEETNPNSPEWQKKYEQIVKLSREIEADLAEIEKKKEEFLRYYQSLNKDEKTVSPSNPDPGKEAASGERTPPPAPEAGPLQANELSDVAEKIKFIRQARAILDNERRKRRLRISKLIGGASWPVYGISQWLALWGGLYLAGPAGAILTVKSMHRYLSYLRNKVNDNIVELDLMNAEIYDKMGDKEKANKILDQYVNQYQEKLNKRHGIQRSNSRTGRINRQHASRRPTLRVDPRRPGSSFSQERVREEPTR